MPYIIITTQIRSETGPTLCGDEYQDVELMEKIGAKLIKEQGQSFQHFVCPDPPRVVLDRLGNLGYKLVGQCGCGQTVLWTMYKDEWMQTVLWTMYKNEWMWTMIENLIFSEVTLCLFTLDHLVSWFLQEMHVRDFKSILVKAHTLLPLIFGRGWPKIKGSKVYNYFRDWCIRYIILVKLQQIAVRWDIF